MRRRHDSREVDIVEFRAFVREKDDAPDRLAMVASTVSSKMVERIAEHEGFKFVECLTGEKPLPRIHRLY